MAWQLQTAKQKFSELVRLAIARGPQLVTRHGKEAVVVLSAEGEIRQGIERLERRDPAQASAYNAWLAELRQRFPELLLNPFEPAG